MRRPYRNSRNLARVEDFRLKVFSTVLYSAGLITKARRL
jgi:hypothetical protein